MAQKKVSGKKTKDSEKKSLHSSVLSNEEYEDFIAKHSADLRKRSTGTIAVPKKKTGDTYEENQARCGEIDPHTTVNPALQRQILTKRTGRILPDDTGFKSMSYNNRFELQPEMPETLINENPAEQSGSSADYDIIPGQQTMADIAALNSSDGISVPIEEKAEPEDFFTSAYQSMKKSGQVSYGKSEKLRAIARTAADDAEMEPESQLTFPAFDPLFKFPENKEENEEKKGRKKDKKQKGKSRNTQSSSKAQEENTGFDIDETEILTTEKEPELPVEENTPAEEIEREENTEKSNKSKIFDLLADSEKERDDPPPYEIESKSDIKTVCGKIIRSRKIDLIKAAVILGLFLILSVITAAYGGSETGILHSSDGVYPAICFFFIIAAAAVSVKEIYFGLKSILRLKFTPNFGCTLTLLTALIQTAASFFGGGVDTDAFHLFAPAAIISMLWVIVPNILKADNSLATINAMAKNGSVSVFKTVSDGGIEGSVKDMFTSGGTYARYSCKASFMSGLMKELTRPVPKPFGIGTAYILTLFFSAVTAVASGIIAKNALCGFTVFAAMITVCVPVSYTFSLAYALAKRNGELAKSNSSLISFGSALKLEKTSAVIFEASDITEKSACSIHGVKSYGKRDPKKVTLYAASVMNAVNSPLTEIMAQATAESEEEPPVAEETEIISGKGVKALTDGIPVILGTKEFMEECGVLLPDEDFEEKFLTGGRRLLYFAVGNEFSMLFTVSYHIKRSVASFFKHLSNKNIKIIINSCDPNISADYIIKKCKLKENAAADPDEYQSSYFTEKSEKVEPSLPADVFTDGKIHSVSKLMYSAEKISRALNTIPLIEYALAFAGAILIAVPSLTGSISIVGNIYVLIIKIICPVLCVLIPAVLPERKQPKEK